MTTSNIEYKATEIDSIFNLIAHTLIISVGAIIFYDDKNCVQKKRP